MGWNDNNGMGPLLLLGSFRKLTFSLLLIFLFSLTTALAQQADQAPDADNDDEEIEVMEYRVNIRPKPRTYQTYKVTELTEVQRVYPDESTFDYTREITFYYTVNNYDMPVDGFTTLTITVDTVQYKLKEGDKEYSFNSQTLDFNGKSITDLTYSTAPTGYTFEFIYSAYNDLADIKAPQLDEQQALIQESDRHGELDKKAWMDGLSYRYVLNYFNLIKLQVPNKFIREDSVWLSPIDFKTDFVDCMDSAKVTIGKYSAGQITVTANMDSLRVLPGKYYFYNVPKLAEIVSAKGNGQHVMLVSKRSDVEKTETEINAEFKVKAGKTNFTEKIKTNLKQEIIQRYRFQ